LPNKLPDLLLGCRRSGIGLVEGLTHSKTEKEMAGRAGTGNVEAPAPNDIEGKKKKENHNVEGMDQTVSGCRPG
jgi:hypothetical protein